MYEMLHNSSPCRDAGTRNSPGRRIRALRRMTLSGKGEERGDLFATIEVELPRALTPEQRTHFEALAKLEKTAKHSAA